jgi:hypothetical protein
MIRGITIATITTTFMASTAFSQMKYSRTRSPSPTPTPTTKPSATPPPTQSKPQFIPSQKTGPVQTQSSTAPRGNATPPPTQSKPAFIPSQKTGRTPAPSPMPQRMMPGQAQLKPSPTPAPTQARPTPTPVPPPDVKAYLDRQVANSKDQKFHLTANGKDLALTPFHVWSQKSTGPNSTSTCIDMKSDDGRIYDIDFVTTGAQVSSIRIHRINGEAVR